MRVRELVTLLRKADRMLEADTGKARWFLREAKSVLEIELARQARYAQKNRRRTKEGSSAGSKSQKDQDT